MFPHPDTQWYQTHQSQQEHIRHSRWAHPFKSDQPTSMRDKVLLASGELFIHIGTKIKRQAAHGRQLAKTA